MSMKASAAIILLGHIFSLLSKLCHRVGGVIEASNMCLNLDAVDKAVEWLRTPYMEQHCQKYLEVERVAELCNVESVNFIVVCAPSHAYTLVPKPIIIAGSICCAHAEHHIKFLHVATFT